MDAPPIQYARTPDGAPLRGGKQLRHGVNIAYWTLGDGPPLMITPINIAISRWWRTC